MLEPAFEAVLVQQHAVDHGQGLEAVAGQMGRKVHDVVAHLAIHRHRTVAAGVEPRQQRSVGRLGPRRRRRGIVEDHALGGDGIDRRRGRPLVAVAAEPVGSQRVDRDNDQVARLRC